MGEHRLLVLRAVQEQVAQEVAAVLVLDRRHGLLPRDQERGHDGRTLQRLDVGGGEGRLQAHRQQPGQVRAGRGDAQQPGLPRTDRVAGGVESLDAQPSGLVEQVCCPQGLAVLGGQVGGALTPVRGGERDGAVERRGHLLGDPFQVAALEHDVGQRGVQRVGPCQRRGRVVVAYQQLASPPWFLVRTSHPRVWQRRLASGGVIHVAAPQRVARRLSRAADGPREVVHRGPHALYVDLDGDVVGLVSAQATRVPCALWSRLPDLKDLARADARVVDGVLVVGGSPVRIGRVVDVRARRLALAWPETSAMTPPGSAEPVGRGPGLTPYGDDVLAGWLVARWAAGSPNTEVVDAVRRLRTRTTALSATLLDCAARGETLPELSAWLRALGTSGERAAEAALLAVGATSGAGLLAGAREALIPTHDPDLRRTA